MTRLITKQMSDSFKITANSRIAKYLSMDKPCDKTVDEHFNSTKKQRILILKRTIK